MFKKRKIGKKLGLFLFYLCSLEKLLHANDSFSSGSEVGERLEKIILHPQLSWDPWILKIGLTGSSLIGLLIIFLFVLNKRLEKQVRKKTTELKQKNQCLEENNTKLNQEIQKRILMEKALRESEFQLHCLNEELEQRVRTRTRELEESVETIKTTQDQLVQSEIMAALGKLVTNVAHEINTPLGAIQSSVGTTTKFLNQSLEGLPSLFQKLSVEHQNDFLALLNRSLEQKTVLTSKEKRQYRFTLTQNLKKDFPVHAEKMAGLLVDMRIYENVESFYGLLSYTEWDFILEIAHQLSGVQRNAQIIKTAIDRASKITSGLKTYSHLESSEQKEPISIIDGIETILTFYCSQISHGVEVIRHYEEQPKLLCYPGQLNLVWNNLICNALHAMECQGTLTIEVSQQNDKIRVAIIDNGPGIPKEIQSKIFDPFFTTKSQGEGCGLGLDIVKKVVDTHHGDIKMDSKPGKTTFSVIFPPSPCLN